MTNARTCLICGRTLPKKFGRPSNYCAPPEGGKDRSDCARLQERLDEIQGYATKIARSLKGDAEAERDFSQKLMQLRGRLWSEVNLATNQGRLWGRPDRKRYAKTRGGWWRGRKCDTVPGMHTLRISTYEADRAAVLAAIQPFCSELSPPWLESGFLLISGIVVDPEGMEEAARNAGAFSVRFMENAPPLVVVAEESPAPVSETEEPPADVVEDAPALTFSISFSSPKAGAIAFVKAVAGKVSFSEPPTIWKDGRYCVQGETRDLEAVHSLARACGGTP